MTVALGRVLDAKVVLEGAARPEGAVVTVLADDGRPAVKLSPELEAGLLAAVDEADAEEGGAGPEFLASLTRPGWPWRCSTSSRREPVARSRD